MAELARLKTKRSSIRGKVTKILKATDKLLSDDIRDFNKLELKAKLQVLQEAIREHQSAHEALLDAMVVADAPEEDIDREIENNATIEVSYDDYVGKLNLGSVCYILQVRASARKSTSVDGALHSNLR